MFAPACLPARAYDTRVVHHLLICSARCCGVHGVRPRGIVSGTVSRPGQARDTLVTHHLLVCSARCCGARGARLQMLWCANASLPAYDTRVAHHLRIWCARWMCIAHCVASEASCSPLRVIRLGNATRVVRILSFVAQDVALHKVSAPEASCTPLLVTPARANGTEWFTAFPAAQEVAVHEVSAPEASCPALLTSRLGVRHTCDKPRSHL